MTALDARRAVDDTPPLFTVSEPRLLAGGPWSVPGRSADWLVSAADKVNLLGRGGAAFPVAAKLAAVHCGARVVVNGSEGEPASWKDRVLMRCYPDLVVAGAALVGGAVRSPQTVIAVGDAQSATALGAAVHRQHAPVEVWMVEHRFVGGEIGALINGLNRRPPMPNGIRVLPHQRGLGGRPTYASNVETFAQLALLSALGSAEYAALGTAAEPGTSLLTLHGTERDGVFEAPHGTDIRRLLGHRPGPVLVGGYHGTWTTHRELLLDRHRLAAAGVSLGAGVVAVLPEDTCPIGEVARVARWLADQSANQCGPCAFGLPAIAADLELLAAGEPLQAERLRMRLGQVTGRGACHHPTGAVGFVSSALWVFDADARSHLAGRPCGRPVRHVLPVGRA